MGPLIPLALTVVPMKVYDDPSFPGVLESGGFESTPVPELKAIGHRYDPFVVYNHFLLICTLFSSRYCADY